MDEQKGHPSEGGEDLRKLKRDIEFLRGLVVVLLRCVIALGIRVSRVEECVGILLDSAKTLLNSVGLFWNCFFMLLRNNVN